MRNWIDRNGGALFVLAGVASLGWYAISILQDINDKQAALEKAISELRAENREERAENREERAENREALAELRNENREERAELRNEIRDNRGAVEDLREDVNDGFIRADEQIDGIEEETARRVDSANGRIDDVNKRTDDQNADTNRRIDELIGQINYRSEAADGDSTPAAEEGGG